MDKSLNSVTTRHSSLVVADILMYVGFLQLLQADLNFFPCSWSKCSSRVIGRRIYDHVSHRLLNIP